jgi:hypothetical protein
MLFSLVWLLLYRTSLHKIQAPASSTKTKPTSEPRAPRVKPKLSLPLLTLIKQQLMFALRQVTHLTKRNFTTTSRIMAQKYEWMVILPDNVGALDKRMAVRE